MSSKNARAGCAATLRLCHKSQPCPLGTSSCDLTEAAFWAGVEGDWQCLYGSYCRAGLSVEWHDFTCDAPQQWSGSFHPGGLELCLNLTGRARLACKAQSVDVGPSSVNMYVGGFVTAVRLPGERHRFLTVEFSPEFLGRHFKGREASLHPVVRGALSPLPRGRRISETSGLGVELRRTVEEMRHPPLQGPGLEMWYEAQALAISARFFFAANASQDLSRSRKDCLAKERVERAVEVLKQDLANPPTLAQLGKAVGCSPFYLSRTFSTETGMTIPQFIRKTRMEKAAEMLLSGTCNVTEAAMHVGYSSLSHFSQAFCDVMGCCPGLYPLGLSRSRLLPGLGRASSEAA